MAETEIRSELNGIVRSIDAREGALLEADGILLVLECMKMEIPVLVPAGGRVKSVRVEEGAIVEEGQVLAIIER
jgi:acetyl-CoA carboxylase biotin carboxyl carrier protein